MNVLLNAVEDGSKGLSKAVGQAKMALGED